MKRFDYEFPVRIHFGQGCFEDSLKKELQKYGKRVMLAYGGGSLKRTGLYDRIVTMLNEAGKTVTDFGGIMSNPTLKKVQEGQQLARETKADLILAVGGGSVSDCCKIVAMGDTPIPLGVVVTASGTGSEQNNGAVITDEEKKVKGAMWGVFADFELMWASAMGENGILKLGKDTDFQCHMIEHQLGAYTDCNHGQGLAVLHPILYRHIYKSAEEKFRRWAQEVWLVQDADEGIDFLADFIREIGLPTTFTEMGIILDNDTIRAIATSTIITPGCCKQLTPNEIVEILKECK